MNKLSNQQIKLDERNHVEAPFLDQLKGLGWEVLDLQAQQTPGETHRSGLTEVLALPFIVGAPQLQGDALAGFCPEARVALEQLGGQFIWVRPGLLAVLKGAGVADVGAVNATR
jgi:hypothetical protein